MKVTIDNLDGAGAVDYSGSLCADGPVKIERVLNAPSKCSGMLSVGAGSYMGSGTPLPVPARRGRMVVSADSGAILFTGYLATEPVAEYVGGGIAGPVYRVAFSAISDEWLLDKQAVTLGANGLAATASGLLKTLASRAGGGSLTTAAVAGGVAVGVFEPEAAASWSVNAGALASSTYAAYRVVDGALSLTPAGTVTHALDFDAGTGGGTLQVATLKTAAVKELANDVTVSGAIEPTAYVTEMFAGDGTTTVFTLSDAPFRASVSSVLNDSFNAATIDPQVWTVEDSGSHIGLGSAGLALSGGNGLDGQMTLTAIDAIEMGGALVFELGSTQLTAGSAGIVLGLYQGSTTSANCFAGYNVRQSGGSTVATPLVNGTEVGTTLTLLDGHTYTMRMRLHCVEMQRVLQTYYARVDGAIEAFGGGLVSAPMAVVFEVQDLGVSSNTPATVLYDGSVASTPATCTFAPVNSLQLFGWVGYVRVTQTGSAWVVSTLPSGAVETRLIGVAGEGVDCHVSATGKVTFFAGRIPVAGETIRVLYRMRQRAVARLEDPASVAAEAAGGSQGTARWLGKVLKPVARCSADCESAAEAVLSFATSRAAAIAGSYAAINPAADVWPGDLLAITCGGVTISVVVRQVAIEDGHAWPEVLVYKAAFANDWAEGLGLTLSEAIAADALLPATALTGPANVLANLQQMAVTEATSTALQLDSGVVPPAGGGFEVRRRDGDFGPGVAQDLVLRSPVRSFSIPRTAQVERYFVRMYDGSAPPVYSRVSSAVFTDLPFGS